MTLRARLALVAALVVAVVVAAASATTYFVMRHELYSQVDTLLAQHAAEIARNPDAARAVAHGFSPFSGDYVALLGDVETGDPIPLDAKAWRVAAGKEGAYFRDSTAKTVRGQRLHLREIVAPTPIGAVVVARDIDYIDHDLSRLRLILLLVSLGGVALAALAGALVSRATLAPVLRLTAAAERIAKTGKPSERVPESGGGELGRLGASFNTMLAALEESLETQRRFVADASHELRTPLTSLQTNLDVLRQQHRLDPETRDRLLEDLQRESREMRALIGGLLELAQGDDPRLERRAFQLDELVESVLERARARFPAVSWQAELEPTVVDGYPERLERAVWNLLENAGKWSGEGSTVEVTLADGELSVRDHGPGIAPEDRPLVFERFYRSPAARSMPGSGLGLAIVREVAEAHGGTVEAEEAPGGGALLRLRLNGAARPGERLVDS
ncbi:MAG: HAMP domain-containing histidine kinase [Thermoleophilia bacterium]|nr:HAMP domain-containing histidine kinase [Thermoleophilia bacterium]